MIRTAHRAPDSGVVSPGASGRGARSLLLERLRARVARMEAGGIETGFEAAPDLTIERAVPVVAPGARQGWGLGLAEIDRHLPHSGMAAGLAADGVHEIAPAAYGDMPAALGFAAALAVRRLAAKPADARPLLWCRLSPETREWGRIYGHGLEALGFPRHRLLTATLNRPDAVLWTIEEALKSTALVGVVADVGTGLDLTTVRRLMLAANGGQTPGLLVFPAPPQGGTAARTRWSVAAAPSAAPPFDDKAPGAPAWNLRLLRCRGGRPGEWFVEWSHATHRFALAAAVSGRTADPGHPGDNGNIGEPAAGAGAGGRPRLAARRL
jgi:protein ImuA